MEMNSWHAFPATTTALPTTALREARGRRAFVLIVCPESSASDFGWKAGREKGTLFMKRQSYFVFDGSLRKSCPGFNKVANGLGHTSQQTMSHVSPGEAFGVCLV